MPVRNQKATETHECPSKYLSVLSSMGEIIPHSGRGCLWATYLSSCLLIGLHMLCALLPIPSFLQYHHQTAMFSMISGQIDKSTYWHVRFRGRCREVNGDIPKGLPSHLGKHLDSVRHCSSWSGSGEQFRKCALLEFWEQRAQGAWSLTGDEHGNDHDVSQRFLSS